MKDLSEKVVRLANLIENLVMLEGEVKFYSQRENFLNETSEMLNSRPSFNQYYSSSVDYSHDKEKYIIYAYKKQGEIENA